MLGWHLRAVLRTETGHDLVDPASRRYTSLADLRDCLRRTRATTVVNCMGYTGPEAGHHLLVNAGFPRVIAEHSRAEGLLAIQISTNAVFAESSSHRWMPEDPPNPSTIYEVSKMLGEDPRTLIIRASFIGRSSKEAGLYERLRAGSEFADRRWNGVTALSLARTIAGTISEADGQPTVGVLHLHSPGVSSFSEVARHLRSTSAPGPTRGASKLLGGGPPLPSMEDQLSEYSRWLATVGESSAARVPS